MKHLFDVLLHVDKHLLDFVAAYGAWIYGLLFAIVFAETGFVVTPFLPGDSLLFAAGALCATGHMNIYGTIALLAAAAFTGNAVNYAVGRAIGPRAFHSGAVSERLLNPDYLRRAHAFFEQYGGKAIVLGRFVPIVRTFVPFVAGAASMSTAAFMIYNLAGALGWVALCTMAGYWFGNIPVVRNNFSLVTIGIVLVSLLPMGIELLRHRRSKTERART
ncbi:MAG TPA: DedA family protein [Vicinamibacterales bacterium]|nr:DedA family protein [Vicinamibacterales bacterium]